MSRRLCWPAPERNREPILQILRRALPERATVLEIASGSGQHAAHFTRELPLVTWIPSDIDDQHLSSIEAWREHERLPNFRPPVRLDVLGDHWPVDRADAIFNANMIHIAPWACCLGLLAGARRLLRPNGQLILYGPFMVGGEHTAPSNEVFDAELREQDTRWGLRNLGTVVDAAAGFTLIEHHRMPANNLTVILRRHETDEPS